MSNRLHAVFGFDMETDIGSWTPYYRGLKEGTPRLLSLLATKGVPATFFFTGHAARNHLSVVRQVVSEGHEVGCHSLYHETVGDELFPIPGVQPLLPEEVPHRLALATDMVAEAAGYRPVSFRCPRLWGSTEVVTALEELGYVADATLPMYFYTERLVPYHPSSEDWTEKGDLDLLEIPVFADLTMESEDKYGRDRDQWPIFRTEGADDLMERIERFAGLTQERGLPTVLCFYFHPWEFIEMPTGPIHYGEGSVIPDPSIVRNCGDFALQQLDNLIDSLESAGTHFYQAKELAETWPSISAEQSSAATGTR